MQLLSPKQLLVLLQICKLQGSGLGAMLSRVLAGNCDVQVSPQGLISPGNTGGEGTVEACILRHNLSIIRLLELQCNMNSILKS